MVRVDEESLHGRVLRECRQLNIRLAELCDVVAELLVPMGERDEAATAAALDRFRAELGDPTR